jgi:hypothetical protein
MYDLPKLSQEKINNLNSSITRNGIENIIKKLPEKKNP